LSKTTSHHHSCENVFGFGSQRDMQINEKMDSSLGKYVVKKGGEVVNKVLEEQLKKSMKSVCGFLHSYVGYNLLLDNCNLLWVSKRFAHKYGISEDFHLQGETGYTSLFYNFDASTLD